MNIKLIIPALELNKKIIIEKKICKTIDIYFCILNNMTPEDDAKSKIITAKFKYIDKYEG
jgi:hypothetical protein